MALAISRNFAHVSSDPRKDAIAVEANVASRKPIANRSVGKERQLFPEASVSTIQQTSKTAPAHIMMRSPELANRTSGRKTSRAR